MAIIIPWIVGLAVSWAVIYTAVLVGVRHALIERDVRIAKANAALPSHDEPSSLT